METVIMPLKVISIVIAVFAIPIIIIGTLLSRDGFHVKGILLKIIAVALVVIAVCLLQVQQTMLLEL